MFTPPPAPGDQLSLPVGSPDNAKPRSAGRTSAGRTHWSWLLGHVFRADLEHCERCGGALRWVEAATTPEAITRLLGKHGLAARPPPEATAPRVPPGQLRFASCAESRCWHPVSSRAESRRRAGRAALSRGISAASSPPILPAAPPSPTEPLAHRRGLPRSPPVRVRLARLQSIFSVRWTWRPGRRGRSLRALLRDRDGSGRSRPPRARESCSASRIRRTWSRTCCCSKRSGEPPRRSRATLVRAPRPTDAAGWRTPLGPSELDAARWPGDASAGPWRSPAWMQEKTRRNQR
jgi:hypothetical protein